VVFWKNAVWATASQRKIHPATAFSGLTDLTLGGVAATDLTAPAADLAVIFSPEE
jgi:hypothetical protein